MPKDPHTAKDNIVQFPGLKAKDSTEKGKAKAVAADTGAAQAEGQTSAPAPSTRLSPAGDGSAGIPGLTLDQEKALRVIFSGLSFVCIGIQPAGDGADFFTAIDGSEKELRQAAPHLEQVLTRALAKRGLL